LFGVLERLILRIDLFCVYTLCLTGQGVLSSRDPNCFTESCGISGNVHLKPISNRSQPNCEAIMYHHIKKLMYTVHVGTPDPRFGNMLLEQFGGANGELAAAMQYSIQGLNCDDPSRKDLLMDIGTEELSHLEVVGTLARLHLKPTKSRREAAEVDPLISIAGGGGASLYNSMGDPWTADYLKITGELDVDLRSNIAAEARAKIVYERLIDFCDDPESIDALQFLMTREITHMKAFTLALESLGKSPFSIGEIPPTPGLVDEYFNDSTGTGDLGETDSRGPWNEGGSWKFRDFSELEEGVAITSARHGGQKPGRKGKKAENLETPERKSA
jgi:Mn-containing catalase